MNDSSQQNDYRSSDQSQSVSTDPKADINPTDSSNPAELSELQIQFGLSTLLVTTVIASMMAAFFRPQGTHGFLVVATTTPIAILAALVVGRMKGDLAWRLFWAILSATIIQIATSNTIHVHDWDYFAWPIIAGISGAILSGGIHSLVSKSILGAVTGMICWILYAVIAVVSQNRFWSVAELVTAAISGAILAVMIDFSHWVTRQYKVPQIVVAFVLVALAIICAIAAPQVIPGW